MRVKPATGMLADRNCAQGERRLGKTKMAGWPVRARDQPFGSLGGRNS